MIRFRTPGPIGTAELRAMAAAHSYTARTRCHDLPADLRHELRVLGITFEPAWPPADPTETARRVPVEGRIA